MIFKFLKLSFVFFFCGLGFISYSYFEWKYFCSVNKNTIEVSIATGDKKCFSYLDQLSTRIDILDTDIASAGAHIKAEDDITYWEQIKNDLETKKHSLIVLRDQFVLTVDDYEQELFLKIKSLVGYYLMSQRDKIVKKIQQSQSLLFRLKLAGDETNFVFVVGKLEGLEKILMILDRIKSAHIFSELIPPLKQYFNRNK